MQSTDNRNSGQENLLRRDGRAETPESEQKNINLDTSGFEKGVILKQSRVWSRAIIWSIMSVTVFAVLWAYFAKIEQVVAARGQLRPEKSVQEIQAPINGVVSRVNVEDGQRIEAGDPLLVFDSEASEAQLESLLSIRESLVKENRFYRGLTNSRFSTSMVEQNLMDLEIDPDIQALALNRASIVEEIQFYESQIGRASGNNLSPEQASRLAAANNELDSRAQIAQLKISQLERQRSQNSTQLRDAQSQLNNDRTILQQIKSRNQEAIARAEESLKIDEDILANFAPLSAEGAVSRVQTDLQRQKVQDRQAALIEQRSNGRIEQERQEQQIQSRLAQIEQLQEEQARINLEISQAQQELRNTVSVSESDVRDRLAGNNQRLSEIDSQLNRIIVDNEKRIAELNSQISSAQQTLRYQELKAPVSGTIFDLQASPGFVPRSGISEPLLKIVPDPSPDNPLIAEGYVTNQDIGFVQIGQQVDVRIDSFSYSEFGDIKGTVEFIGSDALPPDQTYNFYRFPVRVELEEQNLVVRGNPVDLQAGMSVSLNIKVRENRSVLSLFTELFSKKVDSLRQVR
ncbi:HlyD family efflux transporter periplasmic adaptor subunit [Cyanobacterium stanieri LEGE 03274]|uniref:HlyD family efflux transporter periplasmic adaptor subunit n=1 Tax=Cyanobacterium stanieri LEGE 03274 TaxID=1828756 RepID=A0ABR9V2Q3_9CHRO|nr:HlyD family efflux transporter periplasmic adaptor subunit [Cyanobacterium stanieri]MBE9222180.1 HlyD family efflux transporter periplasmic adaptor subunit [Cyanobacterium stanieri LEGE 03274]